MAEAFVELVSCNIICVKDPSQNGNTIFSKQLSSLLAPKAYNKREPGSRTGYIIGLELKSRGFDEFRLTDKEDGIL